MQENKQEKSPIKQKILLYLAKTGVSEYEFYKKSGTTRGILTQNNGISEDNLARFLAYAPDINEEWLLTGKGNMLKTKCIYNDINTHEQSLLPDKDIKKYPNEQENEDEKLMSAKVSADPNIGTPYYDVDFIGGFNEILNAQESVPACNVIVPGFEKASIWCNVTGHSMEPKINHGDIIALHECAVSDIQYGEIYAVVLDTIRTIKILRKGSTPDVLRYVPINTDYDEQEFGLSRISRVFEVIGSISKFF